MPPPSSIARRITFSHALTGFAWLALTLFFFSPVSAVMDISLDSSNYASYTYFAAHHFQYGPQVVPMSGPYGYVMYGSVYNGLLFWTRLWVQLACVGALSALLLWFFQLSRNSAWRWLWLVLLLVLSPVIEDLPFEWTILLTGLFLLQRPPRASAPFWVGLATALLAFISLIKGTHLVLAVATLGVVLVYQIWYRDWRRVGLITGTYVVAFLAFWLLAGQDPRNIPSFIRGIRALTDGYNDAMSLDEDRGAFLRGLLAATLMIIALLWGFWNRRKNREVIAATFLFAGFTFVKWKHGFVRADGHIYIFHHYVAIAETFWFLFVFAVPHDPELKGNRSRWVATVLMLTGLTAGLWIESARVGVLRLHWLVTSWNVEHLKANVDQLLHPKAAKARFEKQLADVSAIQVMPLTQQTVGQHSIDFFGVQHGIVPLNNLNYHPRPMGGGPFNAYNPYLMGLNRDFVRDAKRRPDYYLLRFETIDNRLGAQDDGLTLLEILNHYQPLLIERDHVLLKAMEHPTPVEPKFISKRTFKFSEFVPTPKVADDQILLTRFDIRLNLKGKVRSFLYKAPLMFMTLQGEGIEAPESRRFIPGMASTPFPFSPAIENNSDLANLYTRQPGKQVTGFFVYRLDPGWHDEKLTVEFYSAPRPQPPKNPDIEELLTFTRFPVFNLTPESVVAQNARQMHLGSLLVQTLHAPGEITWQLDGSEKEFVFDYGFMPEAVSRGDSNGAIFIVELHPPDGGPPRELFRKLLDPVRQLSDRINQTSRVPLSGITPGSRLVLRTDPGADGNNAWDWCYVTRVQFKRGYFPSARFPVFNREPSAMDPATAVALDIGAEKVFMLNVPGRLTFDLKGSEHRLQLEYGFLSGAYTGEGHTEGADFVAEIVRPGSPPVEIFRRSLKPLTNPHDRGRFSSEVKLPAIAIGDRLVVRTEPAPGKNNSWGWTYFSRLVID